MALKWSLSSVSPVVILQFTAGLKVLFTHITDEPEDEQDYNSENLIVIISSNLHSAEWIFWCLFNRLGRSNVQAQPGNWHKSLSDWWLKSPMSSLRPLTVSVASDLTLPGLVRSDSRSDAVTLLTLPAVCTSVLWPVAGVMVMISSSVSVTVSVAGGGWTSVWYELLVLTVFLRGVRIMVWETGRFSRVELRRERRVWDEVVTEWARVLTAPLPDDLGRANWDPPEPVSITGLLVTTGVEWPVSARRLLPELWRNTPTSSTLDMGLLEKTVLGSTRAGDDGGRLSWASHHLHTRGSHDRLDQGLLRSETSGEDCPQCWDRSRGSWRIDNNLLLVTACWALARAAISSSCRATGVRAWWWINTVLSTSWLSWDCYLSMTRMIALDVFRQVSFVAKPLETGTEQTSKRFFTWTAKYFVTNYLINTKNIYRCVFFCENQALTGWRNLFRNSHRIVCNLL